METFYRRLRCQALTTSLPHNTPPVMCILIHQLNNERMREAGGGKEKWWGTRGWATREGHEEVGGRRKGWRRGIGERRSGKRDSTRSNERMHTTIMPLVFVTHVATVIVPITDPGWGNTSAIITAKLICVAGSDQCGCRDKSYNIKR